MGRDSAARSRRWGGEVRTRSSQKDAGSGNPSDVKPHITILDQDGKQVALGDMEYG